MPHARASGNLNCVEDKGSGRSPTWPGAGPRQPQTPRWEYRRGFTNQGVGHRSTIGPGLPTPCSHPASPPAQCSRTPATCEQSGGQAAGQPTRPGPGARTCGVPARAPQASGGLADVGRRSPSVNAATSVPDTAPAATRHRRFVYRPFKRRLSGARHGFSQPLSGGRRVV